MEADMCEGEHVGGTTIRPGLKTIPLTEAIGMVLAHDITEIRKGEFKGTAFRKGHVIRAEDLCHLQRLGKEQIYILTVSEDEMHEDEAAQVMADALMGPGVAAEGEPKEGKVNIVAVRDGLLKVNVEALTRFNMLGEVMCATLHDNTRVRKGQVVAGTRAIPLVVKRALIEEAISIVQGGVMEVREMRRPRAGVVITGNEIYYERVKDAFAPIIRNKIEQVGGEVISIIYTPDDEAHIEQKLQELLKAGADLLLTTGGMSIDPDDVTRFAISRLGATDIVYGSPVLPGAMFLVAYIVSNNRKDFVPVLGIPACGMYHNTTVFDLVLPRILAGERIGRAELAQLGHGGLCLNCMECRYPVCPFGK
jgi:molybdopterin biosynthesis enzyme